MSELLCYNKGCGQKFLASENSKESCTFHPGPPFFHDAYKGWSCCSKKVTDFTEFLNIKGCTKGLHNPEKPPEADRAKGVTSAVSDSEKPVPPPLPKPGIPTAAARPTGDEPRQRLPVTIASSLVKLLEHLSQEESKIVGNENTVPFSGDTAGTAASVPHGELCKNPGCSAAYAGGSGTDSEPCNYHPGVAIFHEGMKYWSCCNKKTSDFSAFLAQAGCARGDHLWLKPELETAKVNVRYDHHQTGGFVNVTVYAKGADPTNSYARANRVNLEVHIEFDKGRSDFDLDIPLWGAIDVEKSSVVMSGTKVEIKLKKADPISWSTLIYKPPVQTTKMLEAEADEAE